MRDTLPVTLPYDSAWVLGFLGARALPSVERVTGAAWERATLLHGRPALVRVHAVGHGLEVESSRP
ncbi:MAG: AlkA N-terminal domain-containing protein, partial [Myxococcaceae bacterium]